MLSCDSIRSIKAELMSTIPLLVVDDDPRIRSALQVELDELGIASCFFDNAFDLIDYASANPSAGIFVDLLLPQMNGIDCVKRLRLLGYKGSVFVCTSLCDSDIEKQAIDAGATNYFIKSDLFNDLEAIVASCFVKA